MSTATDPEIQTLLDHLGSRHKSVRENAIRHVHSLSPEDLVRLLEQLCNRAYQRCSRECRIVGVSAMVLPGIWLLKMAWSTAKPGGLPQPSLLPLFMLVGVLVSPLFARLITNRIADYRSRRLLTNIIAEKKDAAFVAPALMLLSFMETTLQERFKLRSMVDRLISHVELEQAQKWDGRQRSSLIAPLSSFCAEMALFPRCRDKRRYEACHSVSFTILKLLEQIGDERDMNIVKQVAALKPKTERDRQIQEAAQECLPYLEVRANTNHQTQTLMRPFDSIGAVSPEILLRPAETDTPQTPVKQLLRPHSAPGQTNTINNEASARICYDTPSPTCAVPLAKEECPPSPSEKEPEHIKLG